jgi:hypothetical protein
MVDCGGDDTSGGPAAGAGGTAGSTGTAGTGGTGGGAAGQGGTGGSGTSGGAGQGGAAGSSGGAGQTGDASKPDGSVTDGSAKLVPFQSVVDILNAQCTGCHKSNDGSVTGLIDLQTTAGLYARLTSPLPSGQEGQCGFPDGGTDDAGDAAMANRIAIVPGDTANSLLYLKISGTQPMGCGARMPRVKLTLDDGGTTTVACDQADGGAVNCLTPEQANTIRDWITQGAKEFPPDN